MIYTNVDMSFEFTHHYLIVYCLFVDGLRVVCLQTDSCWLCADWWPVVCLQTACLTVNKQYATRLQTNNKQLGNAV